MRHQPFQYWRLLFFATVAGYCLYYAPYGLNETDGGFLTGLAWQTLNGKALYHDIVYVRPPMPVWLRAQELRLLPEDYAVLGERWIFYGKVALYAWLGAAVLSRGQRRWQLAALGFVVSAHCYPPMAWHTVDGILFATMAAFFLFGAGQRNTNSQLSTRWPHFALFGAAGVSLFCVLLCKQSFYPLLPLFAAFLFFEKEKRWVKTAWFLGAILLCTILFFNHLHRENTLSGFLRITSGAASGGQALQHGVLDYFRITPELALPSLLLLAPVAGWFWKGKHLGIARMAWFIWLLALVASYAAVTWLRQEHTVPFAQARAMFWVAGVWFLVPLLQPFAGKKEFRPGAGVPPPHQAWLLLGISWCASVSWGYNLPILFATPWVWAGMEISRALATTAKPAKFAGAYGIGMLLALLLAFRVGHEFVYRDGKRSEMSEPMGAVFPSLSGIWSDPETAGLYRELKQLAAQYGPNFKTLPAFPQANFLTKTAPPLPLDWVVNRETNNDNTLVFKYLKENRPIVFVQKAFREKIGSDPEMEVARRIFQNGQILGETPNFWVVGNYEL